MNTETPSPNAFPDASPWDPLVRSPGMFTDDFMNEREQPPARPIDLDSAYREMATDVVQEQEAQEWLEGTAGDVGDAPFALGDKIVQKQGLTEQDVSEAIREVRNHKKPSR